MVLLFIVYNAQFLVQGLGLRVESLMCAVKGCGLKV